MTLTRVLLLLGRQVPRNMETMNTVKEVTRIMSRTSATLREGRKKEGERGRKTRAREGINIQVRNTHAFHLTSAQFHPLLLADFLTPADPLPPANPLPSSYPLSLHIFYPPAIPLPLLLSTLQLNPTSFTPS